MIKKDLMKNQFFT